VRGLAPLRRGGFRLLFAGQLASNLGDALYAVALPWYVLAAHGSPETLGIVLAAYGVPRTAMLLVGGQASDRWNPWTVMMAADAVRAVALAAFAATAATGTARVEVLVPVAVVLGAAEGMFLPGAFAIIPRLLPSEELQAGNALVSGSTQLTAFAGPAFAGILVAAVGPASAFALDAVTFAVSTATLLGVPSRDLPALPVGEDGADVPTVRSLLRTSRVLQLMLLITIPANLGIGGEGEVALPALAHGPLHASAAGYGALVATFGAGALLGVLVAGQLGQLRRPAIAGSVGILVEAIFISAVPYLGGAAGAGAMLFGFGALNGFCNVVMITAFQRWAPPQLMGRLAGLLTLSSMGVFPVSAALAGAAVGAWGPAPFFLFAGLTTAIPVALGLTQQCWRDYGAAPRTTSRTPAPTGTSALVTAGSASISPVTSATSAACESTLSIASRPPSGRSARSRSGQ
jgi:predicted MFS family arabinose efflux permease